MNQLLLLFYTIILFSFASGGPVLPAVGQEDGQSFDMFSLVYETLGYNIDPQFCERCSKSLEQLGIAEVPNPPESLFMLPSYSGREFPVGLDYVEFFFRLQNLVRNKVFDEILFSTEVNLLGFEYMTLQDNSIISQNDARLFSVSSYYFHLMRLYHKIFQHGVRGKLEKECSPCIFFLMRELELEISSITFLEFNGVFILSKALENPIAALDYFKQGFSHLESQIRNHLEMNIHALKPLIVQHRKLSALVGKVERFFLGFIPTEGGLRGVRMSRVSGIT